MTRPALAAGLALVAVAMSAACAPAGGGRAAQDRSCPAGTERAAAVDPGGREQWCRRPGSDVRHGPYLAWHENGRIRADGAFAEGREDGRWRRYYASGRPLLDGEYRDGVKQGPWTFWFANGVVKEAGRFRDGREEGRWARWFENGRPLAEGEYRDGVPQGRWTRWHESGAVRETGEYRDGRRAAPWRRGSVDGQPCDNS